MHPLQLSERAKKHVPIVAGPVTTAERELAAFVSSIRDCLGSEQTRFLTEIWLDELASMDSMPEPTSPDWRLVTVAASARLASRLIDVQNHRAPLRVAAAG
jgi:hypothetical protein